MSEFFSISKQVNNNLEDFKEESKVHAHYKFQNLYDFLQEVIKTPQSPFVGNCSRDTNKPEWYGSKNIEECIELAKYGWPEGLESYKNIMEDFKISFSDIIPVQNFLEKLETSLEGEIFVPEKHFAGDPESMLQFVPSAADKLSSGRSIQRLVINSCVNFYVSAQTFFYAGVIYQELINALELSGFSVELWSRCAIETPANKSKVSFVGDVCVKSFNEIVDIDKLLFFTAHPSILRRFYFSLIEQSPRKFQEELGSGYGEAIHYTNDLVRDFGDDGTIFLPSLNTNPTKERILNLVRELVQQKFNPKDKDTFAE